MYAVVLGIQEAPDPEEVHVVQHTQQLDISQELCELNSFQIKIYKINKNLYITEENLRTWSKEN